MSLKHANESNGSQVWSLSNFSCSLTRNITSHSMENVAFHSLLRWKLIILATNSHYLTLNLGVKGLRPLFITWRREFVFSVSILVSARKRWNKVWGWGRVYKYPYIFADGDFFGPNAATAPKKLVKWTMYLQLPSSSSCSFERLLTKQSFGLKKSVMESDVSHESLLKQCTRKQVSADLYATSHSLSWQQCLMQMSKSPTSPIFVKFPALRPRARVVSSRTLSAWQTGARCFLCLLPFSSGERQQINFEAVLVLDIHSALVNTLKVDSRISVFLSQRGIKNADWATWCSNLIPVWCSRSNNRSTQSAVSWILTGDFQEVVNCPKSTEVFNPFSPKLPSYWELVV